MVVTLLHVFPVFAELGHQRCSMWASMMRRTSSAMEMPRRFASRFRNALCGSVNEIICLVIGQFIQRSAEADERCIQGGVRSNETLDPRIGQANVLRPCGGAGLFNQDHKFLLGSDRFETILKLCQRSVFRRSLLLCCHVSSIPQGIHAVTA